MVSASRDASVRIWDLPSGRPLLKLAPETLAYQAYFTPDGNALLTAAQGIQRWDASESKLESRMARLKTIDGEMRLWHRQEAARARDNRHWNASLFHLNQAIELLPDDPGQYWDRSWMKMYLAQWAGAAADLSQAVEGNPKSIDMQFHRLAALLIAGDATGYRAARTQMIQRFEETDNWFVAYLAARMAAQVLNHLVLALAYNKLHNATEARRHYDEAIAWITTAQALPAAKNPQRFGVHPVDWLTCLVLRREAEVELGIEPTMIPTP